MKKNDHISKIRARFETFNNSYENYTMVKPKYIYPVLRESGFETFWSDMAAHSKDDVPYLLEQPLERDAEIERWREACSKCPAHAKLEAEIEEIMNEPE